jgi:hypothetical protein
VAQFVEVARRSRTLDHSDSLLRDDFRRKNILLQLLVANNGFFISLTSTSWSNGLLQMHLQGRYPGMSPFRDPSYFSRGREMGRVRSV